MPTLQVLDGNGDPKYIKYASGDGSIGDPFVPNDETTLAAILAKIIATPATAANQATMITALGSLVTQTDTLETLAALLGTEVTLAAVNTKLATLLTQTDGIESSLSSIDTKATDGATQTTLAAVLAKLIAAPSTEAKQDTANTKLDTLHTDLTSVATQATLAAILAKILTAPATEAKQDTTNTKLDTINTSVGTLGTQTTLAAILAKILTAPATEAKQDTGNTSIASIDTKTPALGQAVAGSSTPVVLPTAQITALTPPAAITGFATSAKQDTQITAEQAILAKLLSAPATEAKQDSQITALGTLNTSSNFDTKIGSLTETAPASDTALSGLNGRLQRIAQRIASLIALFPTALGQTTKANSLAVTPASDYNQPILPVNATPALASVAANNTDMLASTDVSNYSSGSLLLTGTFSATINAQVSLDGGTTWHTLLTRNPVTSNISASMTVTGTLYTFDIPVGALLRIRTTTYASGTVTGNLALSSVLRAPITIAAAVSNGTSLIGSNAGSDTQTIGSGVNVAGYMFGYNGSNADRWRANNAVSALASAARTATANADVTTYNAKTFRVILNITAAPNTASTLTLAIRIKDSISGNYITKLSAVAITGSVITGSVPNTTDIQVGAGLAVTANVSGNETLARTMNVLVTHSNSDSWTYSVSVELGV